MKTSLLVKHALRNGSSTSCTNSGRSSAHPSAPHRRRSRWKSTLSNPASGVPSSFSNRARLMATSGAGSSPARAYVIRAAQRHGLGRPAQYDGLAFEQARFAGPAFHDALDPPPDSPKSPRPARQIERTSHADRASAKPSAATVPAPPRCQTASQGTSGKQQKIDTRPSCSCTPGRPRTGRSSSLAAWSGYSYRSIYEVAARWENRAGRSPYTRGHCAPAIPRPWPSHLKCPRRVGAGRLVTVFGPAALSARLANAQSKGGWTKTRRRPPHVRRALPSSRTHSREASPANRRRRRGLRGWLVEGEAARAGSIGLVPFSRIVPCYSIQRRHRQVMNQPYAREGNTHPSIASNSCQKGYESIPRMRIAARRKSETHQ